MFNVKKVKDYCVGWIRSWFDENGKGCNAVVGISGGKDSTIVAALCVEALGKDNVIGVIMPNQQQSDINVAYKVCEYLDIMHTEVNIGQAFDGIFGEISCSPIKTPSLHCEQLITITSQTVVNLPPRIRMTTLYAVSQSLNGRVANTCNLSENWIGYSTHYGDSAGDFSPLANLTVTEVKKIGYELGIPEEFIEKVPSDGLCGKTDEDNLGFSYDVLDNYIRTGAYDDIVIKEKIDSMHKKNLFKLQLMPEFKL